jgi:hypothetical protein
MNPSLAWLLTRLYPRPWRERYGAEFEELLETGHGGVGILANAYGRDFVSASFQSRDSHRTMPPGRLRSIPSACARR